jgi:hypothetical protein
MREPGRAPFGNLAPGRRSGGTKVAPHNEVFRNFPCKRGSTPTAPDASFKARLSEQPQCAASNYNVPDCDGFGTSGGEVPHRETKRPARRRASSIARGFTVTALDIRAGRRECHRRHDFGFAQ